MDNNERLAIKYKFIRSKMFEHYKRGCKYLKIAKIVDIVLFLMFTVIFTLIARSSGNKMLWLVLWIINIFLNVTIFWILDYVKYLIDDKVIPYLLDDRLLEFGEYDIFKDDIKIGEEED